MRLFKPLPSNVVPGRTRNSASRDVHENGKRRDSGVEICGGSASRQGVSSITGGAGAAAKTNTESDKSKHEEGEEGVG